MDDVVWVTKLSDVNYLWGGENYILTDEDIERLKKGYIINFFVNEEYGCTLRYEDVNKDDYAIMEKARLSSIYGKCNQDDWIVKTKSTFPQYQPDEYECPRCHAIVNYKTKFCPECGARLKGGDES